MTRTGRDHFGKIFRLVLLGLVLAAGSACSAAGRPDSSPVPGPAAAQTSRPGAPSPAAPTPPGAASGRPTLSATPPAPAGPTPTPAAAASPGRSPTPPLSISACLAGNDCPEARPIQNFMPGGTKQDYNVEYTVVIPVQAKVIFFTAWCAKNQAILADNLKHLEFTFTIDQADYLDAIQKEPGLAPNPNDSTSTIPCMRVGAALSGWKAGEAHRVVIGSKISAKINDGWQDFNPGSYLLIYLVKP